MARPENPAQENFEDALFAPPEPAKPEAPEKSPMWETPHCYVCEDVGACGSCERGRQWRKDNPLP